MRPRSLLANVKLPQRVDRVRRTAVSAYEMSPQTDFLQKIYPLHPTTCPRSAARGRPSVTAKVRHVSQEGRRESAREPALRSSAPFDLTRTGGDTPSLLIYKVCSRADLPSKGPSFC